MPPPMFHKGVLGSEHEYMSKQQDPLGRLGNADLPASMEDARRTLQQLSG